MSTAVDMQHDTTEPPKRGRKPTPAPLRREQCNFRLPQWLIEWVDAQPEGRGEVIEAALIKAHKLKPPSWPKNGPRQRRL